MQTFLPYANLKLSVGCLDNKRLGKQRVEAKQILNALWGKSTGWVNHPAVRMWRGHEAALMIYHDLCIEEWVKRGFKNTMPKYGLVDVGVRPLWFGREDVFLSHQSNLLRKDQYFYMKYGWQVPHDLPYIWPV